MSDYMFRPFLLIRRSSGQKSLWRKLYKAYNVMYRIKTYFATRSPLSIYWHFILCI